MEKKLIQLNDNAENCPEPSFQKACPKLFAEPLMFVSSNSRDSLDNNPFDRALKEVRLKDDPFEMKTKQATTQCHKNVQIAKLIDFGTDQMATILEDQHNHIAVKEEPTEVKVKTEPIESTSHSACSSKGLNYALINHQNLQAIRSPFFGKKVFPTATKPLLSRIKSDPGVTPDSPATVATKWCQYREPNRSLNAANLKTDLRKLMETDGMSFSEEARKITNQLMCSNALTNSLSWTASDNSSFEDLQNTQPPKFPDTDMSDLEAELADLKIPMLDEIKQIEAQHKLEEERESDKKSLLSSYNTLKHNAEIQQLQLEQEQVDSAMKTQTMVDVRRFKEILLKHKTSELSKSELLEEIEKAFEAEVGPPKPQRQLTFDVVESGEGSDEDETICEKTMLEQTVLEAEQTSDLEAKFQLQMKALFKTFSELNSCSAEPPQLNLDLSTVLPGGGRRKSVISSTPNMPSVVRKSRLSVNPTARGHAISPMLKKHARMTLKPTIQRPSQTAAVASRPLKLKTSPIRALAPTKRANPPMIAVHPVPRSRSSTCTPALDSSTVGTPAGKRVSYAMTPKATRTAMPENAGGGRRRSLTAGATPKVVQFKPGVGTPARTLGVPQAGGLHTTPSKMAQPTMGTPASRRSVLGAPQSIATPSRRSLLPSQSGPRNLMNQMTPRPIRKVGASIVPKNQ